MKKKIVVVSVRKVKDGHGANGKPWSLFVVTDNDKVEYSTFNEMYASLEAGSETEIEYSEETVKGYLRRTILEGKKAEANTDRELLKEINRKLDILLNGRPE